MTTELQQESASLYALDALDADEAFAFEAELCANVELQELVASLRRATDIVALASPQVPLPESLRSKVLERVSALQTPGRSVESPLAAGLAGIAGLRFEEAAESRGWKPLPIPGAFIKLLSLERERGYAVLLGKLEPGTRYPAHVNSGPEDFFVLSGDLVIGDRKLSAGDFHHADSGSQHVENHSVGGCTLLAVLTTADPLVAYAMA